MQFFVWLDDSAKTTGTEKIQAAIAAYVERFKVHPNLVLVNPGEVIEMQGITVQTAPTVQPNTFWLTRNATSDA
jgi:hypothetical protein